MRTAVLVFLFACGGAPAPAPRTPVTTPPRQTAAAVAKSDAPMSEEALRAHVAYLASPELAGRAAGTEDEKKAAAYVAAAFTVAGLAGVREQTFALGSGESRNVMGTLGDGEEIVVVGAHMDHLGRRNGELYLGAEDNASGIAVLSELARALAEKKADHKRKIVFVAFGAEEVGLVGSRHFVQSPPVPIKAIKNMVNIDMIGRRLVDQSSMSMLKGMLKIPGNGVGVVGTRDRPDLRKIVDEGCAAADLKVVAPEDLPGAIADVVDQMSARRGDNAPFEEAGVPSLFFGSGESDDYHKPTDVIDRLDFKLMARRARAIANVVAALARR
jgi:Zn-dependent M28 family amino/carboxypeptidase